MRRVVRQVVSGKDVAMSKACAAWGGEQHLQKQARDETVLFP